jgi:hypothetical protein
MITKSDFQSWKDHPVTIAYFDACKVRVEDAKEILSTTAGLSSEDDNFYRGFIAAYREKFSIDSEELS